MFLGNDVLDLVSKCFFLIMMIYFKDKEVICVLMGLLYVRVSALGVIGIVDVKIFGI